MSIVCHGEAMHEVVGKGWSINLGGVELRPTLVEGLQEETARMQDSHMRLERELSDALSQLAGATINNHPTARGT